MPYLFCQKREQKMKVNIEVCFNATCPHVKGDGKDWK